MQLKFPCGAKGSPGYCPDVCQYGKFCKIKDRKAEPAPSADELLNEKEKEDAPSEEPKVEMYY